MFCLLHVKTPYVVTATYTDSYSNKTCKWRWVSTVAINQSALLLIGPAIWSLLQQPLLTTLRSPELFQNWATWPTEKDCGLDFIVNAIQCPGQPKILQQHSVIFMSNAFSRRPAIPCLTYFSKSYKRRRVLTVATNPSAIFYALVSSPASFYYIQKLSRDPLLVAPWGITLWSESSDFKF